MVFSFVAGAVAGAIALKFYQLTSGTEDTTSDDTKTRAITTSSRATLLNSTLGYNDQADTTGSSNINFLSDVVDRLWPYMRVAIADTVKASVEPSFAETLPGKLATLKFRKIDLGKVPLVIDNILVRELREIDDAGGAFGANKHYLQFEWDITWQSDCDIQLATDKIAGMAAISFGIKSLTLSGRLQVIAKPLSNVLPCIDAISFAFVNPPKIDLDFTGLANLADMKIGVGGVNVLDIRGMVRGIVDDIFAASMVLPVRVPVPLVENVDFRDLYHQPYKGMARVKLHSGRGFEIQKSSKPFGKDDIPDVYCKIRLGASDFFKSSVCQDNCNPVWDPDEEFDDFLVCSNRDQILEIQAWDHDSGTLDTNDELGVAFVTLGQIVLEADRNGLYEVQLMERPDKRGKNEKPTGQYITISLTKLPFTSKNLSSMDPMAVSKYTSKKDFSKLSAKARKKQEKKDNARIVGLTTILVSHATNLPFATTEQANTFVKVYGGTGNDKIEMGVTATIPNSLNPQYMTPIAKPITVSMVKEGCIMAGNQGFVLEVFSQDLSNPKAKPKSMGEILIDASEIKKEGSGDGSVLRATRCIGKYKDSELAFTISFAGVKPVVKKTSSISSLGSSTYGSINFDSMREGTTLEGTIEEEEDDIARTYSSQAEIEGEKIRVTLVKGYGFRAEQKKRFRKADVPDVYCMIKFGSGASTWRTQTIKDSETPEWENEFHDYQMESMNEVISIDVWDENRRSDDEYYGNARTSVAKVIMNGGVLDVEVKKDRNAKKGTPKKKDMAENTMFITVQCEKL